MLRNVIQTYPDHSWCTDLISDLSNILSAFLKETQYMSEADIKKLPSDLLYYLMLVSTQHMFVHYNFTLIEELFL